MKDRCQSDAASQGTLEDRLKQKAHELGFDLVGIAAATEADGFAHFATGWTRVLPAR